MSCRFGTPGNPKPGYVSKFQNPHMPESPEPLQNGDIRSGGKWLFHGRFKQSPISAKDPNLVCSIEYMVHGRWFCRLELPTVLNSGS